MKILDGDVLPGEALTVDADLKKGEMTFARNLHVRGPASGIESAAPFCISRHPTK
jgi:hypothetical protein